MNFVSSDLSELLKAKLASAVQVRIASAFFSPSELMLVELLKLTDLKLVISEEFTVNDPYKLSRLARNSVRSVPTDDAKGKLHAKVFIVKFKDGTQWVLLGSANLTQQGMAVNQEACIEMCSTDREDGVAINRIINWFNNLFDGARPTDLKAAIEVFNQRSRYRLEPRPTEESTVAAEYWAIKTRSRGTNAEEHWPRLLRESVVAIGWEELDVNPSQVDDEQLRNALARFLDPSKPRKIDFGVRMIRNFINMPVGSIVVLCRGLVPSQTKPVHIYAFARIVGPFREDPQNGTRWRFKRNAVLQEIGAAIPAETFARSVKRESFRQTMHRISPEVVQELADNLGVSVEV